MKHNLPKKKQTTELYTIKGDRFNFFLKTLMPKTILKEKRKQKGVELLCLLIVLIALALIVVFAGFVSYHVTRWYYA